MSDKNELKLDDKYFENLFNLENLFYQSPNEQIITDIIYEYNKAIEYYHSLNDKRKLQYTKRLKKFISNPSVRTILNLPDKDNPNKRQSDITMEISKLQSDEILYQSNKVVSEKNKLIENELENQDKTFKEKLNHIKYSSNSDNNNISTSPSPKSSFELGEGINGSPKRSSCGKKSIDILELLNPCKPIGSHQQRYLEKIHSVLENFISTFNSCFCCDNLKKFSNKVYELINEKYEKYSEAEKHYNEQLNEINKEVLDIIQKNEEIANKERLDLLNVVKMSLEEEKQDELDNIEDIYNSKIKKIQNLFNQIKEYKSTPALTLQEEELRYNLTLLLLNLVSPP